MRAPQPLLHVGDLSPVTSVRVWAERGPWAAWVLGSWEWGGNGGVRFSVGEGGPKGRAAFFPGPSQSCPQRLPAKAAPFLTLRSRVSCTGAPGSRVEMAPAPLTLGQWGVDRSLVRPQLCPACWTCPSLPASLLSTQGEWVGEGLTWPWAGGQCSHWLRPGRWSRGEGC